MIDDIRREVEVTVAPLLRDILQDTQKLFRQEWTLAKTEVREDARRARDGITALSVGFALSLLSFLFANLMLVYLFVAAYGWAEWQAFGAVALFLSLTAGVATWWGRRRLRSVRFSLDIPFSSLRENIH